VEKFSKFNHFRSLRFHPSSPRHRSLVSLRLAYESATIGGVRGEGGYRLRQNFMVGSRGSISSWLRGPDLWTPLSSRWRVPGGHCVRLTARHDGGPPQTLDVRQSVRLSVCFAERHHVVRRSTHTHDDLSSRRTTYLSLSLCDVHAITI